VATTLNTLQELKNTLKSNLILVLAVSTILASVLGFFTSLNKEKFEAYSKIFPLSINKSGGSSPIDAIKSQFGISDKTDYDKIYNITELVKSKRVSHKVVKSKVNNKKYKTLAEWIIDDYNTHQPFYSNKVKIKSTDTNGIIYAAAGMLLANVEVKSEKTDFTTIVSKAYNADLAKEINEDILTELSSLYISMTTEKPRNDLGRIATLRDSLKDELYAVERAIAGFQDANQLSVKYTNSIPQAKLLRTREELEKLYETTASAFQNARFKLLSESPIFQVLDQAGPPYNSTRPSAKNAAIVTFLLSFGFLSFFVCRKIFWKLIVDELSNA
jgi:uncharacterized protein involved in exopolysaccharide biosynthesis